MEKLKNWLQKNGMIACIFLLLGGLMFYYIQQKQGFHEDEIFSYGSSNYQYDNVYRSYGYAQADMDYFWNVVFNGSLTQKLSKSISFFLNKEDYTDQFDEELKKEVPIWKTKDEALDYLSLSANEIFNFFSIWLNQALDVHPPLFYFMVHFFSIFFLNHFTKYIIFSLNLVFFFLTLMGIVKILRLKNLTKYQLPVLILYGASMGAISTVMFQRMYMMLTCFGIWYLYYSLKFYQNEHFTKKDTLLYGLIILFGFLTQYYFCVYAVGMFFFLSAFLLKDKQFKKWRHLLWIHVIPALGGILLFPTAIEDIFFSYRGLGGSQDKTKFLVMLLYFSTALQNAFSIPLLLFILLMIGLIYLFYRSKAKKEALLFWGPMIIFILVVAKISPFLGEQYTSRYIMMIFPIFVLACFILLDQLKGKHIKLSITIVVLCLTCYGLLCFKPSYLYQDYQEAIALAEEHSYQYLLYAYDNYFTHLNSLPEMTIYQKHKIINVNNYDFTLLQNDQELQEQDQIVLCLKNWINQDETLTKILANTSFTSVQEVLKLTDSESTYYILSK